MTRERLIPSPGEASKRCQLSSRGARRFSRHALSTGRLPCVLRADAHAGKVQRLPWMYAHSMSSIRFDCRFVTRRLSPHPERPARHFSVPQKHDTIEQVPAEARHTVFWAPWPCELPLSQHPYECHGQNQTRSARTR